MECRASARLARCLVAVMLITPVGGVPARAHADDVEVVYQVEDHAGFEDAPEHFQLSEYELQARRVTETFGGKPNIFLSFDDGSTTVTTDLLGILDRYPHVKVTFFVNCKEAVGGTFQRILDSGHAIGNHSCSHLYLTTLSSSERRRQLKNLESFVNARIREPVSLGCYRPPFGATNTAVRADAKAAGYPTEWLWSVDPKDWQRPGVDKILAALKGMKDGDVIVLHDSVGKTQTVEAVRLFLAQHHNDYIFRTLPDCGLGKPPIPGPYDDVFGDHRFANDIEWLRDTGLTRGCNPDGTRFCPEDYVTRGQMAAFLTRALKLPASPNDWFRDDHGSIFESAINAIAEARLTRGCNPPVNDRFCPDSSVTRGEMATFLVRALDISDDGGGKLYSDTRHSIFESAIDRLGTAGITRGCNQQGTLFCPDEYVTRGQMAAFLKRAAEQLAGK